MEKIKYFGNIVTMDDMVKDLRERGLDPDNDCSDDFLITEAYNIGEWDYIE